MGLPPSRPAFHSRSYTSGLWVWGGLMMMGASGVGRLPLLSAGRLIGSPSFSVRRRSWPSSLCIGWSDGEASGSAPTVEPDCESVSEEDQRWLKWDVIQSHQRPVRFTTDFVNLWSPGHISSSLSWYPFTHAICKLLFNPPPQVTHLFSADLINVKSTVSDACFVLCRGS